MDMEKLLRDAEKMQPRLIQLRRDLHRCPELGFELPRTRARVKQELEAMGIAPVDCGKAGIVALLGGKSPGKTFLLRGDMDALPMQEKAAVEFSSEIPGQMHACGHDLHTAMLLGAAKLLKERENDFPGTVKLMFQPAEECFQGAEDMVRGGVLENPAVDAAMMIHVISGQPMPAGMFLVPTGGVSTASCQLYHITVRGKGGHGSTPHLAVDPITAAAHIHLALQEINSRELDPHGYGVFTTCKFRAGETGNVIPETAEMWGTIRTMDPEGSVGDHIKTRMSEITRGVGAAMRCEADVVFGDYCPCVVVDEALSACAKGCLEDLFGPMVQPVTQWAGGSEDFSYVSLQVPAATLFLSAGDADAGYEQGLHNPKVRFDESALWRGSAAYAGVALRWLEENA